MSVGIPVRDVMIKNVITATPNERLADVVKKIVVADVGSLVVVEKSKPVGIITRGDLLKAFVNGADFDRDRVKDFMTSPVITSTPNEDIESMARMMRDKKVKRVPIVKDDGQLVGIVSQTDLINISPALYEIIRERAKMER